MKAKRVVSLLAAAVLAAGALAGCGSSSSDTQETTEEAEDTEEEAAEESSEETSSEETEEASEETSEEAESEETSADKNIESCEITFWHSMTGEQETTLTELTDQFNSENEYGITVTLVNQGEYSDLSTKLTANAAAGTLPDLSQAYNSWLIDYIDMVVPLDDFVENDYDDYDDIIESYREETSEFGFINAMPFNKSTYVYFYNKTMFDELGLEEPTTWDDLITIGETFLAEKDMVSLGFDDMAGMLEAFLLQDGAEYVSEDGALFDNDEGLETVEFIMELYNNGYARLVGEDGYFSSPFSNQLIAAYVGSSTGVSYITAEDFELGVAPLPGNVTEAANTAGTNIVMFSDDENSQLASWEYLKFLTSVDATTTWAMETGYLPVRTSAYESETYQEFMAEDPTATASYEQSDAFFHSETFDGSYDVQSTVDSTLEEVILNEDDAETALDALVSAINKAVD